MEAPLFFGKLIQKKYYFAFRIHLFRKRLINQKAAVMIHGLPSFYANYSKTTFVSADIYETIIASKDYCTAHHEDKMCFLLNCRYHILLMTEYQHREKEALKEKLPKAFSELFPKHKNNAN